MAFSLIAKLGMDNRGFALGLQNAEGMAKGFGKRLERSVGSSMGVLKGQFAAVFSVAALTTAAKGVIDFGSKIFDLSKRTDISAEKLQELNYAADQNSASIDQIVKSIERLARAQTSALQGDKQRLQAFERFGVTVDDLKRKKPEDLFLQISENIQKNESSAIQTADAMRVMGEEITQVLPAMKNGFAATADEARRLGIILSSLEVAKLKEAGDNLTRAKAQALPFVAEATLFGGEVMELVKKAGEKLQPLTKFSHVGMLATVLGDRSAQRSIQAAREAGSRKTGASTRIEDPLVDALTQATKDESRIGRSFAGTSQNFDSLAKIGGFAQGSDRGLDVAKRQLQVLQDIEQNTQDRFTDEL